MKASGILSLLQVHHLTLDSPCSSQLDVSHVKISWPGPVQSMNFLCAKTLCVISLVFTWLSGRCVSKAL